MFNNLGNLFKTHLNPAKTCLPIIILKELTLGFYRWTGIKCLVVVNGKIHTKECTLSECTFAEASNISCLTSFWSNLSALNRLLDYYCFIQPHTLSMLINVYVRWVKYTKS